MHTSTILEAGHFAYHRLGPDVEPSAAGFEALCPDYHPQDRLGIVAVPFEAGLRHTGLAVLAWTTAFYDALRRDHPDGFYDYPQHYLFYAADEHGPVTETEPGTLTDKAVGSWGRLDLWPDCKRVSSPDSVSDLVRRLFEYEINRLLWPRHLTASADEVRLPNYMARMLRTRLKGVYLYGSDSPTIEIRAAEPALLLTRETREQAGLSAAGDASDPATETYEQVDGGHFLDRFLGPVFEKT